MMLGSCQIYLSGFLAIQDFHFDIINSTTAIVMICICLLFIVFALYLLNNSNIIPNTDQTLSRQYEQLYGVLYEGLKRKAALKRNIYIIWIIRKLLFSLLIIYTTNNNILLQGFILIIIQTIYLTLISMKQPYDLDSLNFIFIFGEILIFVYILCLYFQAILDFLGDGYASDSTQDFVNFFMILIFLGSLGFKVIGQIIEFIIRRKILMENLEKQQNYMNKQIVDQEQTDFQDYLYIEIRTLEQVKKEEEDFQNQIYLEELKQKEQEKIQKIKQDQQDYSKMLTGISNNQTEQNSPTKNPDIDFHGQNFNNNNNNNNNSNKNNEYEEQEQDVNNIDQKLNQKKQQEGVNKNTQNQNISRAQRMNHRKTIKDLDLQNGVKQLNQNLENSNDNKGKNNQQRPSFSSLSQLNLTSRKSTKR